MTLDSVTAVSMTAREALLALETDAEYFLEFFLAEELTWPVPAFHVTAWHELTDVKLLRKALAMPRSHSKTTLAKLAVVWHFLFTPVRFSLYMSNTARFAKNACIDVLNYFDCANFRALFGSITIEKESETDGLWIFKLVMPDGRRKRCILRATGAGQQMRGLNIDNKRPEFAVVDDLEDYENTATPELRNKLSTWFHGTFMKALNPQWNKVIFIGNMISATSILASLTKEESWNPTVFGALVKTDDDNLQPLWPDLWSVEALIDDFRFYKRQGLMHVWMAEMMNLPGQTEYGFSGESINYQPTPVQDELEAAFVTIDPAFGLVSGKHDKSAIVAHGIDRHGLTHILAVESGHFTEPEIYSVAKRMAQEWGANVWGIESIAAQRVLLTLFESYLFRDGLQHKIELVPVINGANTSKVGRIRAWVASMKGHPPDIPPTYAIAETDMALTTRILEFDVTKKDQQDDELDACSMGLTMLSQYLETIRAAANSHMPKHEIKPRFGLEVSGV